MRLPIPALIALGLGLVSAIICDLRRRRIPNALSLAVFVTGLVATGLYQGPLSSLSGLAAAVIVVLPLYAPWNAGGIGGGDVKLAAATSTWLGLGLLLPFALATTIAGGGVAACCYMLSRPAARADVRANVTLAVLQGELPPVPSHRAGHLSVPYAVAIAAGTAVAWFFS
jgi:prepilin peptidase CpaA